MNAATIAGVARAQALAREVVLEVAQTVRPGQTEREVVDRLEDRFARAKVRRWIHTPYAWFGERSGFGGFSVWEVSALPQDRRLEEGESFVLDAAPLVDGFPADFAYSGLPEGVPDEAAGTHQKLLTLLAEVKAVLPSLAQSSEDGTALFRAVGERIAAAGATVVHDRYPAGVLGHTFSPFPNVFGMLPRLGDGFQPPLLGTYAAALAGHHLFGAPYPFLREGAKGPVTGLFAVEPHVAIGPVGAKFESILLVDGDETRWLDDALFGPVQG
jgi:hypothetical protein